jgi:hypothetical protein
MRRLQFIPFWRCTNWGFLLRRGEAGLRIRRGCDEYHNPSRYTAIPMVGSFILFDKGYDTDKPEHLYARGPDGTEGYIDPTCAICTEILEDFDS